MSARSGPRVSPRGRGPAWSHIGGDAGTRPSLTLVVRWVAEAWLPITVLLGTGLFVAASLPLLGAQGYWTDEQLSVGVANETALRMLRLQSVDIHPPAYSVALWIWIRLTGTTDEAVIRLVSLAAMALGLVILAIASWRRFTAGAALIVLALGTTSALVALFAREARPHGLAFAAVCLVTATWLFALDRGRPGSRAMVPFAIAGGLAALTQYYALIVYAAEVAVLASILVGRRSWGPLARLGISAAASLVPVGAWMAVSVEALRRGSSAPPLDGVWAAKVAGWASEPFNSAVSSITRSPAGFAVVGAAAALATLGLVAAAAHARSRADLDRWTVLERGAACLAAGGLAVAAAVVQSLLMSPSLSERTVLVLLPLAYIAVASTWPLPLGRWSTPGGAAIAATLLVIALRAPDPSMPNEQKDQWREAAAGAVAEVRSGLPPDRLVLVEPWWGGRTDWTLMLNNAVERPAPATDLPPELANLTWIRDPEQIAALGTGEPLYLLAFHYWAPERHAAIVEAVERSFGQCEDRSVTGITVLACEAAR